MYAADLLELTAILVLGLGTQWLAWRLRLPAVPLVIVVGLLAGPGLEFLGRIPALPLSRAVHPELLFSSLMLPIVLLATLGISTIGTLFSAMAVSTRAREVMLPLLFLPAAVPIIIAAVETTGLVLREQELTDLAAWLPLMAAFDAVFLVVCPVAFHFVVED
ncbi:MAG: heme exporter protein CcmB [Planctomycetes bacterium]|nr:heme exporter protein CcmB [Planctomycetota bacterium]